MSKNTKKHRYLLAGQIHFIPIIDGEEVTTHPQSADLNAVLATDSKKLGARELGRAQQALQMQHHRNMEDPESYKIFDVVIFNMIYLGLMSDAEYANNTQSRPAGEMKVELPMLSTEKH